MSLLSLACIATLVPPHVWVRPGIPAHPLLSLPPALLLVHHGVHLSLLHKPTPAPFSPARRTQAHPAEPIAPTRPASQGQIVTWIRQIFGGFASGALRVAECESGLNPRAVNPTPVWDGEHAEGVYQIIGSTFARTPYHNVFDPWQNIAAAYWIFHHDGDRWTEWACQP
jgi:hypothetical protein